MEQETQKGPWEGTQHSNSITCAAFVSALHCSIHLHEHPIKIIWEEKSTRLRLHIT